MPQPLRLRMSAFSNLIRLTVALVSLGAAFGLLRNSGLPERPAFSGFRLQDGAYVAAEIGAIAPILTLHTPEFSLYTLIPNDARVSIVNFWATWCRPCREELQLLQALHDAYPDSIRVVAVNLGESPATVSRWIRELGLTYDVLIDPIQSSADSFRVRGLPTTFLLDAELRIRQIIYGAFSREQLQRAVDQVSEV